MIEHFFKDVIIGVFSYLWPKELDEYNTIQYNQYNTMHNLYCANYLTKLSHRGALQVLTI